MPWPFGPGSLRQHRNGGSLSLETTPTASWQKSWEHSVISAVFQPCPYAPWCWNIYQHLSHKWLIHVGTYIINGTYGLDNLLTLFYILYDSSEYIIMNDQELNLGIKTLHRNSEHQSSWDLSSSHPPKNAIAIDP